MRQLLSVGRLGQSSHPAQYRVLNPRRDALTLRSQRAAIRRCTPDAVALALAIMIPKLRSLKTKTPQQKHRVGG
jgi:hypothetical protein